MTATFLRTSPPFREAGGEHAADDDGGKIRT